MNNLISVDENILAGKPVITGTRIPVSLILNLIAHGYDIQRIQEAYPILNETQIQAALLYAENRLNREEIHPLLQAR